MGRDKILKWESKFTRKGQLVFQHSREIRGNKILGREEQGKVVHFHVVGCKGQGSGEGAKVSGEDLIEPT